MMKTIAAIALLLALAPAAGMTPVRPDTETVSESAEEPTMPTGEPRQAAEQEPTMPTGEPREAAEQEPTMPTPKPRQMAEQEPTMPTPKPRQVAEQEPTMPTREPRQAAEQAPTMPTGEPRQVAEQEPTMPTGEPRQAAEQEPTMPTGEPRQAAEQEPTTGSAATAPAGPDADGLESLMERVNVQADSARLAQVIDGEWVAVGIRKPGAICRDHTRRYDGRPSYRFSLGRGDNTLQGYAPGETKGRAELSYCYATADDLRSMTAEEYDAAQRMKTVYHHGKGICRQGSKWGYTFAVYVPSTLDSRVSTIFAQWHGMPDRTLATAPDGTVRRLSVDEFLALEDTTVIKKDQVFRRIEGTDKRGRKEWKAGEPTGWKIEQGGYPPLAFGFSGGWFYIKANSDRRWFTDKTDRCNAGAERAEVMKPVTSEYKASTIAYKLPFGEFPKDCWVTFDVEIAWTRYGGEAETVERPGCLDVKMAWNRGRRVERRIVDNRSILIGRNDEDGYYFKFGIYRVGGSSEPVSYNLAGYRQEERQESDSQLCD